MSTGILLISQVYLPPSFTSDLKLKLSWNRVAKSVIDPTDSKSFLLNQNQNQDLGHQQQTLNNNNNNNQSPKMPSIQSFLQVSRKLFANNLSSLSKITLVSGNQSCDLDSVVSAISYSFLHHLALQSNTNTTINSALDKKHVILPLLNIPQEDLHLRRDIEYALAQAEIDSSSLLFLTDLQPLIANDKVQVETFGC
ncbi:unnamed protein product [Ambrosiozyma monospora]|uniref:Unnamed protein product n=1 Tax=Ambrosiozyma monospora TaxID=43982 RepID=A0ACB5T1K2_AMBMO|nr:unnamed protein product [Ambrosiozyma monospora]